MTKTLLFVRHASAGEASKDFERPLTNQGERDATHLGFWLLEKYPEVDFIISSTARRAVSTAENIAEVLKIHEIKKEPELYEASVRTMLEQVNQISEEKNMVIMVGHNPTISYCADYITSSPTISMEPGSMIAVEFNNASWNEISQGTGELKEYANNRTYR